MTSQVAVGQPAQQTKPWAAFWAVSIGFFMIMLDTTIIAVAQPNIQAGLQATLNSVIWANSAYLLAYAVPMLLAGRLGDRFGPRNIYIIGVIVFTIASVFCGVSNTITLLILARGLQGIGAALMGPQTLSVVNRVFPKESRGAALAAWGGVAGLATFSGPLIGGVIVALLGWKWIFFVNVPLGILAIPMSLAFIPRFAPNAHHFDILGVILSGLGMFGLVFSLQQGQHMHWDASIIGLLVLSIVLLGAFLLLQKARGHHGLVPLFLFGIRDFSISVLVLFLLSIAVNAQILPVMFYLQRVEGLSTLTTAMLTVSMPLCGVLLAKTVGKTIGKVTAPAVIVVACAVTAIGVVVLKYAIDTEHPVWLVTIGYAIFGIGAAFIWSPLAAYATRDVPPEFQGAASGVFNTFRIVGAVLGNALIALVIEAQLVSKQALSATDTASLVIDAGTFRDAYEASLATSVWLPFVALVVAGVLGLALTPRTVARR